MANKPLPPDKWHNGVRLRGDVWYVRYYDAAGERRNVPTLAKSRTMAEGLLAELKQKTWRQRQTLEALPAADGGGTVGELLTWWLDKYVVHRASGPTYALQVAKNYLRHPIADIRLADFDSGVLVSHLQTLATTADEKTGKFPKPATLNKIRGHLGTAFNCAIAEKRWRGSNPITSVTVKPRRVPKAQKRFIRPEEVEPFLRHVAPAHRALLSVALYTGLRQGELMGLEKVDVDLTSKPPTLTLRRSWDRDITKNGETGVVLPLPDEVVPALRHAMRVSPGHLVFPAYERNKDGVYVVTRHMYSKNTRFADQVQSAMRAANLLTHREHRCRIEGCGHVEEQLGRGPLEVRSCPVHRVKLWPVAMARHLVFHDLRHTTATLLAWKGVDPAIIQALMRHSSLTMTMAYVALVSGEKEKAAARMAFGFDFDAGQPELPPGPKGPGLVPRVGPGWDQNSTTGRTPSKGVSNSSSVPGVSEWAHQVSNLGPLPCERRGGGRRGVGRDSNAAQALEVSGLANPDVTARPQSTDGPSLPSKRVGPGWDQTLAPARSPALSIAQVATELSVSRATVYALVERGELPHYRVGNSIRVRPEDLQAFTRPRKP